MLEQGRWLVVGVALLALVLLPSAADDSQCGTLNPPAYYQRYRRSEYPANEPFFQWWYFWIHNEVTHEHFYFSYGMLDCPKDSDPNSPGVWLSFGVVNGSISRSVTLQRLEHFDNSTLSVNAFYDLSVTLPDGTKPYQLTALDNDTYLATGRMNHTANQALNMGVPSSTVLSWNLTISRIWGWYGESGNWETIGRTLGRGALAWNTYAHGSLVQGVIQVGDVVYNVNSDQAWRAYCDMNWGQRFLDDFNDKPAVTYGWSWFKVGVPEGVLPGVPEVSIIAGQGLDGFGFPAGVVMGEFVDVRFGPLPGTSGNESGALEAREVGIWWNSAWQHIALEGTSDGTLRTFAVSRAEWSNFTDPTGTYAIPLNASITIETDTYLVSMNFTSSVEQYNRIPFEFCTADFEALGVTASVSVSRRSSPSAPFSPLFAFTSVDAGLEYGYRAGGM